jgi:CspA family cold shock protein
MAWRSCLMIDVHARSSIVSQGNIKKVSDKGFGFIEGDRGDIFFHSSAVADGSFNDLREGQLVEYSEGRGPKGPCAENVRVVS